MTTPGDDQKVDLLFKEFTGVANVLQNNTFAEQIKAFRPNIMGDSVLTNSIPFDLADISYDLSPPPAPVSQFVYGCPALDASYGTTTISGGIAIGTDLTYFHRRPLSLVTGQTAKTYYIDDGSGNSELMDTVPFKYDQSYNSYNHVLYQYDPSASTYLTVNMWSAPYYWLLDNKSGYLELYGDANDIASGIGSQELRMSYIKYTGPKGVGGGGGGGGDASFNNVDISGNLYVGGDTDVSGNVDVSGDIVVQQTNLYQTSSMTVDIGSWHPTLSGDWFQICYVDYLPRINLAKPNLAEPTGNGFVELTGNMNHEDGGYNAANQFIFHMKFFVTAYGNNSNIENTVRFNMPALTRDNTTISALRAMYDSSVPAADRKIIVYAQFGPKFTTQNYPGKILTVTSRISLNGRNGPDTDVGGLTSYKLDWKQLPLGFIGSTTPPGVEAGGLDLGDAPISSYKAVSVSSFPTVITSNLFAQGNNLIQLGFNPSTGTISGPFDQTSTYRPLSQVNGTASPAAPIDINATADFTIRAYDDVAAGQVAWQIIKGTVSICAQGSPTSPTTIAATIVVHSSLVAPAGGVQPVRSLHVLTNTTTGSNQEVFATFYCKVNGATGGSGGSITYLEIETTNNKTNIEATPNDTSSGAYWRTSENLLVYGFNPSTGTERAKADLVRGVNTSSHDSNEMSVVNQLVALDVSSVDLTATNADISMADISMACIQDLSCVQTLNGLTPDPMVQTEWTLSEPTSAGDGYWYTIAEVPEGGAGRGDALFSLVDRTGSHHHTVTFRATYHFNKGVSINVESSTWFSRIRYHAIRIARKSTYSGALLQVQFDDLSFNSSVATQYMEVRQNVNELGWTNFASGVVDGSDAIPILPDLSAATAWTPDISGVMLGYDPTSQNAEAVSTLDYVYLGNVDISGTAHRIKGSTTSFENADVSFFGGGSVSVYDEDFEKSGTGNFEINGLGDITMNTTGNFLRQPGSSSGSNGKTTISGGAIYLKATQIPAGGTDALYLQSTKSAKLAASDTLDIHSGTSPGIGGAAAEMRIHSSSDLYLASGINNGAGVKPINDVEIKAGDQIKLKGNQSLNTPTAPSVHIGDPSNRHFTAVADPFRLYNDTLSNVTTKVNDISGVADGALVFAPTTGPLVYMDNLLLQLRTQSLVSFVASLGARTHATSSSDANQSVTLNGTTTYKPWAFHMVNQGVGPVGGSLSAHGTTRSMYPAYAYPYTQVKRATLYPFASYANNPAVNLGTPASPGAATNAEVSFEIWVASTTNTYATDSVLNTSWFSSSWVTNAGRTTSGSSRIVTNTPGQDASGWAYKICNNLRSVSNSTSLFNPWSGPSNTPMSAAPVDLSFAPFTIPFEGRYVVQVIERIIEVSGSIATTGFVNFHGTGGLGYKEFHGGVNDAVPLQIDLHITNTYEQSQ